VVDDDVSKRTHGIVEITAILNTQALGHRDLHARDVLTISKRAGS
jgi:hypothetical protein